MVSDWGGGADFCLYPLGLQSLLEPCGKRLIGGQAESRGQGIAEGDDPDRLFGRSSRRLRKPLACHKESQNQHDDVRQVHKAPLDPAGRVAI